MIHRRIFKKAIIASALVYSLTLQAIEIKVKVEVLTPVGGVFTTPVWVGFHDGEFDTYDTGAMASEGMERLAEDGDASTLSDLFSSTAQNGQDAVIINPEGFAGAPVFEPGSTSTMTFDIDESVQRYMSYATMIIPSNDAFISNENPKSHQLFNESGTFVGPFTFTVYGSQVSDAGTEENTESDAAFLNQSAANTGMTTAENISAHQGFNGSITNSDAAPVNILGGTVASGDVIDVVNGDFKQSNYAILRITVSKISTPVRLTIKNTAPTSGVFLTPFWVAFHDGGFDTFDSGALATEGLEHMAEDGDSTTLRAEFSTDGLGTDAVIINPEGFAGAPLFDPGFSTEQIFELDPSINRYFSYVSMILPSNDAFIANANPKLHELFNVDGSFSGPVSFKVYGSQAYDAGTEDNTESDAAFFNQSAPNTGNTTTENISSHPGYNGSLNNPNASPQVFLGGTNGAGIFFDETAADFSIEGQQIAEISISKLIDGSFSGTWYDPARSGEGFLIEVTENSAGVSIAVVTWYSYLPDGSGRQMWLVGSGPVLADTILADMTITDGASFGANFNSGDVNNTPWGQLSIKFNSCNTATISFVSLDLDYGSGQYVLQRLTKGPSGYKGACQL